MVALGLGYFLKGLRDLLPAETANVFHVITTAIAKAPACGVPAVFTHGFTRLFIQRQNLRAVRVPTLHAALEVRQRPLILLISADPVKYPSRLSSLT